MAPVGPEAKRALDGLLEDARDAGVDVDDVDSIQRGYDDYLLQQLQSAPAEREDPTMFCTMIGVTIGEHLARRTDLVWRVVTDDEGTDLALSTPSENAILFPTDPVFAAWAEQEDGWVAAWVTNLVESLRGQTPPA